MGSRVLLFQNIILFVYYIMAPRSRHQSRQARRQRTQRRQRGQRRQRTQRRHRGRSQRHM